MRAEHLGHGKVTSTVSRADDIWNKLEGRVRNSPVNIWMRAARMPNVWTISKRS